MSISPSLKSRLLKKHLNMSTMKDIKIVDTLTDRAILDPTNNLPIYVINTNYLHIDNTRWIERTALIIPVVQPGQSLEQASSLVIPSTWVPWPVTLEFPKESILGSIAFRQSLTHGNIAIVDPDTAIAVLSTPEGKAEYDRARNQLNMGAASYEDEPKRASSNSNTLAFKENKASSLSARNAEEEAARKASRPDSEKLADMCSPKVTNFVTKVVNKADRNEEVTAPEVADFLITAGEEMTEKDMEYFTGEMLAKFPEIVNNPDVHSELDAIAARLS